MRFLDDYPIWLQGGGLLLCLLAYSLLTSAETAFSSLSRSSLEKMRDDGLRNARRILRVYKPKRRLYLTISVAQTLVVAIAVTMTLTTGFHIMVGIPPLLKGVVGLGIAVGLLLLFKAMLPPMLSDEGSEQFIARFGLFVYLLHLFLWPITALLSRLNGIWIKEEEAKEAKEEELMSMVESESEEGIIEEEKKEMIHGIFHFSDTSVREVMVPRIDMICAEESIALRDLVTLIEEVGHSRIPMYRERIDNIQGIIYSKDLLQVLARSDPSWKIGDSLREAYFVPESMKIDQLLREFKRRKIHIAIVVDEYGGTAGLVTLEDLLEEIVGEIQDEYDEEEQLIRWEKDGALIADARMDIDDLNKLLNVDISAEGFDTLGGVIYNHLGRIPIQGDVVQLNGLSMRVVQVEGHRISKVRIVKERSP